MRSSDRNEQADGKSVPDRKKIKLERRERSVSISPKEDERTLSDTRRKVLEILEGRDTDGHARDENTDPSNPKPMSEEIVAPLQTPHSSLLDSSTSGRLIANWQAHRAPRKPLFDRATVEYNRVRARANPYVRTASDVSQKRRTRVHRGCEKCRRYAYSKAKEHNNCNN